MGTDIHSILRVKKPKYRQVEGESKYFYVSTPGTLDNRNYNFFAILANVRNGYGFAGIPRYESGPIQSYTDGRGFPSEIEISDDCFVDGSWIGDHNHGYVTLKELKENYHLAEQEVIKQCVIDLDQFEYVKKHVVPTEWSGSVSGSKVVTIHWNEAVQYSKEELQGMYPEQHVYIQYSWRDQPFKEMIDRLISWMELYNDWTIEDEDDIQFIFGFDS